jgi:exodeoxyribonuclease VII small subunit
MAKPTSTKAVEDLSYEAAFAELQELVAALEGEPASLDKSIALFERGQALARRCAQLLEEAELKVKRLAGSELADFEED